MSAAPSDAQARPAEVRADGLAARADLLQGAPVNPMAQSPTTPSRGSELRETARLALPLALATAGNQLLTLVDTVIAGRMGEQTLAATGISGAAFTLIAIFPIGVMLGLDPLVSQALGRGDRAITHQHLASARRLAVWLTPPTLMAMTALLGLTLLAVDLEAGTAEASWGYLAGRAPSILPFMVFMAHRSMLQAWDRIRPIATSMIVANAVNLPVSAVLAMGDDALVAVGLPAIGLGSGLGAAGIGLGTTVVSLCQLAWLARASRRLPEQPPAPIRRPPMGEVWRLGWPVGLQLGSEVSIFAGTMILMGLFGETAVAAHQVALNVASFTFTICVGISSATTVRVGLAVGAADPPRARRAAWAGLGLGVGVMCCTATGFVLFGEPVARLFTDVEPVIEAATGFLLIAAFFQILDGLQVIGTAGLRGAGLTRQAMVIGVVGYWIIGFPVALGLAFGFDLGPSGLWYGLVAGLAFSGPVASVGLLRATAER